jgi:hypothetical protein
MFLMRYNHLSTVMPAQRHPAAYAAGNPVFAGIHVFLPCFGKQDVDGRDKPGHDSGRVDTTRNAP